MLFLPENTFRRGSHEVSGVLWNFIPRLPSGPSMLICCTLSSGPPDIRLTLWQEDPNVSPYLPPLHFLFIFHIAAQVMVLNVTYVHDHVPPWSPLMTLQGLGNTSDSLSCLLPGSLCMSLLSPLYPTGCSFFPQYLTFPAKILPWPPTTIFAPPFLALSGP